MPPRRGAPRTARRGRSGAGSGTTQGIEQDASALTNDHLFLPDEQPSPTRKAQQSTLVADDSRDEGVPNDLGADNSTGRGEPSASNGGLAGRPVRRLDAIRGGRVTSGSSVASSKFKPKAVGRRAQNERDALEKEAAAKERERQESASRAREAEARRARQSQGHFPRGRGRGAALRGDFGGSSLSKTQETASGPFSALSTEKKITSQAGWTRGRDDTLISETAEGGSKNGNAGIGVESESRGAGQGGLAKKKQIKGEKSPELGKRKPKIKAEGDVDMQDPVEASSATLNRRRDIDCIYISSDGDDSDPEFIGERRLKPMIIENAQVRAKQRRERERRATSGFGTDEYDEDMGHDQIKQEPNKEYGSTSKPSSQNRRATDVEFLRNERRWKGVYPEEDAAVGTVIKQEPGQQDTEMTGVQAEIDPLTHQVDPPTHSSTSTQLGEASALVENKQRSSRKQRTTQMMRPPLLQTKEDEEEWQRTLELRHAMVKELSLSDHPESSESAGTRGEKVKSEGPSGKMYLFQLPPGLPKLKVRDESMGSGQNPSSAAHASGQSTQKGVVNVEDRSDDAEESLSLGASEEPNSGQIGTLSVYEDGTTSFSWGGIDHEVKIGSSTENMEAVIIDAPPPPIDNDGDATDESHHVGVGTGVGPIEKKFIVTPNLNKLLGGG